MAKNSDQYIDKIVQQIAKCDGVVKQLKGGRAAELKLRAQNMELLKGLQSTQSKSGSTSSTTTSSATPSPKRRMVRMLAACWTCRCRAAYSNRAKR